MSIQCRCGRFLGNVRPVTATEGEGYSWHEFLKEVRGDCSRCGPNVLAGQGPWLAWDAWDWEDDRTAEALP